MGALEPYSAVKDSGTARLGKVPEHWELRKLRRILRSVTIRNRPDLPLLSVVRDKGVIVRDTSNQDENRNVIPEDLSNYKVVREGQFAVNKMKAWQGSYGVSAHEGIVSPAYFVFDLDGVAGSFFNSAIRSRAYVPCFAQASDGVRIGQWDLSQPRMREIVFAVPPRSEQTAIVRYLDHQDRRVRRLVRAKRKLIALFEEQKRAIIQRVVTRGLDSDVGPKDSGVEWLGQTPGHWETRRLKTLFRELDERTSTGEETLLSLRMYEGLIPHREVSNKPVSQDELIGYKKVKPGQLVMNRMRAAIGIFGVPVQAGLVSPDYAIFAPVEELDLGYFLHLFKTKAMCAEFRVASRGLGTGSSGFMRLYSDQFGTIRVPFPPPAEQAAIVRHIDRSVDDAEAAIGRTQREIGLLSEYQARLNSDVVTGKLDVRVAAAALTDEVGALDAVEDLSNHLDTDTEVDLHDAAAIREGIEA